eukprot:1584445-Prymnesium_polylepis.3
MLVDVWKPGSFRAFRDDWSLTCRSCTDNTRVLNEVVAEAREALFGHAAIFGYKHADAGGILPFAGGVFVADAVYILPRQFA